MIVRIVLRSICFLLLLSSATTASTLHGTVRDKKTNERLIGVIVRIAGGNKGAKTGLDGSYRISNIPAGAQKLQIKYSGYKQLDTVVSVPSNGDDVRFDAAISIWNIRGNEVTVTDHSENGSEMEASRLEQHADNVVTAVSARAIEISPDISVANVSQRIAGVSVTRNSNGDAQYAIIRGMDKRYNYTTVNGIKIPSPDNKNRYVPLDIFPGEMLDRLEVTKSLLPSMEGDAIGGAMNLVMKQAPEHEVLSAKAASGYSGLFLGRKFYDVDFQGAAESPRIQNGNSYAAKLSDFPLANFSPVAGTPAPNQYYSVTYGDRFFEDQRLGVIANATFHQTSRGANSIFFLTTANKETSVPDLTDENNRIYSNLQTRSGFMTNIDYRLAPQSNIKLFGMYANLQSQEVRDEFDSILGLSWPQTIRIPYTRRVTVQDQGIANVTLGGDHAIFGDELEADWKLAYSSASLNEPDRTTLDLYGGVSLDTATGNYVALPYNVNRSNVREWASNSDVDKSAYLTLKSTESLFGLSTEFSYGGMLRMKNRTSSFDHYELTPDNTNTIQRYTGDISRDTFTVYNPGGSSNDPLNYSAHENVTAGFVQIKFQTGDLQTIGGLRIENTDFGWESQAPDSYEGKTGTIGYMDILPSVSFKYMPTTEQNWRLSLYRSISRPGFFEVIPNTGIKGEDYTETANPYLNRTQATNVDLRWEYFPGGLDQIIIGGFFKHLQDPIEYSVVEQLTKAYLEPKNWGDATNFGFEFDFRKYFHKVGIQLNYTYTNSRVTTDKQVNYRSADPAVGLTFRIEQQTRPLQGQSAHIGNASLLYKDFESGTDAQLGLVYTGENIVSVSPFKDNDIWQKGIAQLDFSAEQKLYGSLTVFLKVNNILNTPREEVIHQPYSVGIAAVSLQSPGSDILIRREYYDRTYLLGFRYNL